MTDPMTPERLAEIEARVDAATPGPWHARDRGIGHELHHGAADDCKQNWCEDVNGEHRETFRRGDAEFIAAARNDVPALLAEVRRLQAAAERVRELLAEWSVTTPSGPFPDRAVIDVDAEMLAPLKAALDGPDHD